MLRHVVLNWRGRYREDGEGRGRAAKFAAEAPLDGCCYVGCRRTGCRIKGLQACGSVPTLLLPSARGVQEVAGESHPELHGASSRVREGIADAARLLTICTRTAIFAVSSEGFRLRQSAVAFSPAGREFLPRVHVVGSLPFAILRQNFLRRAIFDGKGSRTRLDARGAPLVIHVCLAQPGPKPSVTYSCQHSITTIVIFTS